MKIITLKLTLRHIAALDNAKIIHPKGWDIASCKPVGKYTTQKNTQTAIFLSASQKKFSFSLFKP